MIVTTINVNGVRAAVRERSEKNRGLLPWLAETSADVVCLQETRADDEQLAKALAPALADGWRRRVPLHQLHPLLVHVALFGAAYREKTLDAARAALAAAP